jgi:hypothetical protein
MPLFGGALFTRPAFPSVGLVVGVSLPELFIFFFLILFLVVLQVV